MSLNRSFLPTLLVLVTTASLCLGGERPEAALSGNAQTVRGLGTTAFPTSTRSPEAQAAFLRGLLLLHLFEYEDAAAAFISAEKLDPAFVMAYWGEAMCFNHGVWNQVDVTAGRAALEKLGPTIAARAERATDPREKAYLGAVELLYDGTGSKVERDKRYSQAMERVSNHFPNDRNAQLFRALALLSQSEGVRDVPVYLQAAEISKTIFRLEPQNPGAAHYWIHGMDDPDHAAGALEAARALSSIAPEAAHAQHMCSHIFMALGMWDDVVQANVEAICVGNLHDQAQGFPPFNCGHYAEWLEYGYFQQGRLRQARQTVSACEQTDKETAAWVATHSGQSPYGAKDAAHLHHHLAYGLASMRDMATVESQDWTGGSGPSLDVKSLRPSTKAWWEFTDGLRATESGDLVKARSSLQAVDAATDSLRSNPDADPQDLQALLVAHEELEGFIQVKSGSVDAGLAKLRQACERYSKMAFAFGPPVTVKPPDELLGEILLEKGDARVARASFEQSLQRAPSRALSLLGLARAEHLAGDEISARNTYQKLLKNWHAADADAPSFEEARKAGS